MYVRESPTDSAGARSHDWPCRSRLKVRSHSSGSAPNDRRPSPHDRVRVVLAHPANAGIIGNALNTFPTMEG
jgi:hypothetical protein